MKPTNLNQPNLVGPDFTLDEFGCTYHDLIPPICPIRKD